MVRVNFESLGADVRNALRVEVAATTGTIGVPWTGNITTGGVTVVWVGMTGDLMHKSDL